MTAIHLNKNNNKNKNICISRHSMQFEGHVCKRMTAIHLNKNNNNKKQMYKAAFNAIRRTRM